MKRLALAAAIAAALGNPACSRGPAPPAALDVRADSCAWCRMSVSDPRLAAQLVATGEEPLFFDDIGCLADHLARTEDAPEAAVAYVADHRTGDWVAAGRAIYTKNPGFSTPMGSHLLAHADDASRQADPAAAGSPSMSAREIFGSSGGPPVGKTAGSAP